MQCLRIPPGPTGRGFCGVVRSQGFTLGYFSILPTGETVARGLSALCFEGRFLPGLKAAIVPAVFRGFQAPAPSGNRRRVGIVLSHISGHKVRGRRYGAPTVSQIDAVQKTKADPSPRLPRSR
jgi:hypothetical protein